MFIMEDEIKNQTKADIRIVGVGGGGSNALEIMIEEGIKGVQFIAVNTDHQALENSSAEIKVQLGSKLTKGLGAGANPEVGRRSAVESYEEIIQILQGADMVFVTAGMGGGTGTGGAPLVVQAAKELGILTVGIVTKPFLFEGQKRMKQAEKGIKELRNDVDTLIVIPNEKLLKISQKDTPLLETFKITDNVLLQAVKGIAELVSVSGLINLDFADVKTVMLSKGMALMGRGVAEGADRAKKAVCSAISSPLLDGVSIKGATGMIVNITASSKLSLIEVQEASSVLTQVADDTADVIVGAVIDENMGEKLSVTVIATGFEDKESEKSDTVLSSLKQSIEEKDPLVQENLAEEESTFNKGVDSFFSTQEKDPLVQENLVEEESTFNKGVDSFFSDQENSSIISESDVTNDEDVANDETEEKDQKQIDSKDTPGSSLKSDKKLSAKDMLLSKAKEYTESQNQQTNKEVTNEDNQMSMDWKENQLEENLSSPFESSLDFSDEDMI